MKLEKLIGDHLRKNGWTLSIAESCTGGLINDRITDVPGSSNYYEGGMVSYSNKSKTELLGVPEAYIKRFGAVSPQVAKKMAQGVRKAFNTTFGLSTTGIAGPTGGSKKKPLGLVFIAVSDGKRTIVKKEKLKGNRKGIKRESACRSLKYLYDFITKAQSGC
ncbi:MAG: CinA family protein [Candidatus Eisenbacteria bacterium]|nr:CinA family protein [Candidatus Eisenbacteria bacterium]